MNVKWTVQDDVRARAYVAGFEKGRRDGRDQALREWVAGTRYRPSSEERLLGAFAGLLEDVQEVRIAWVAWRPHGRLEALRAALRAAWVRLGGRP